ncbi:MAG TPA: hypothetical protein VMB85_23925 [Bryobacteraceae bacterium]|nr:hypothetical protein [Bryobacteraceae bacterium]
MTRGAARPHPSWRGFLAFSQPGRAAVLAAILTVCAFAAVSRDPYRQAYRAWREADPTLERDAAAAGPALSAAIDRVSNQAARYSAALAEFFARVASDQEQRLAFLNRARAAEPKFAPQAAQVVASEIASVRHSLQVYGNDPDPGIQQVRGMLDRENAALAALASALDGEQKAAAQVESATNAEEQARLKSLTQSQDSVTLARQQVSEANQEAAAWSEYYRTLSNAARGVAPAPVTPPVTTPAPAPAPEVRVPSATITPLPLARYAGAWTYPMSNGLFHGLEPEFVDLVVHDDENGRVDGTLFGRFKVSSGDPVIRFDFSGEFQNKRDQVFPLQTSDGAKGTVELIPGPAFNLLEIDFETEPKPGKVRQGNFMLVKK